MAIESQVQALADYLPGGRVFSAKNKNGSTLRKFLSGLATELTRLDDDLQEFKDQIIPSQTTQLLPEWERAVGIPDDSFLGTGTLIERRRDILVKLASLGVQTVEDFEYLGTLYGIGVTVKPAAQIAEFPMTFPFYLLSATEARFTMVVTFTETQPLTFPLTFPATFGSTDTKPLENLFLKLKPANTQIIFEWV